MNCRSSLKVLFIKLPGRMRQKICDRMITIIRQEIMNLEADLQDVPDSSTKEEMWSWHRTLKELEDLVRGTDREVSKKESEYARLRRGINMEIAHLKGQDPATYRLTVEGALGILNRLLR